MNGIYSMIPKHWRAPFDKLRASGSINQNFSSRILSLFYFLAIAAIVFIVGAYYFIVYHYSVNIPYWDDYAHLNVITSIVSSNSITEKLQLLVSFHNEHRIVFARLVTLAALVLEGDLNFVTLIMLGNLSLLGIGVLLFFTFNKAQDYRQRIIYFLPVVLLLFNLSYYEASTWAVAALSSLPVIFLSFLCILALSRSEHRASWWVFLAFFLGVLSAFTQGNGLLVLYVGAFLLILQKRFYASLFWSIGAVVISCLYLYNFTSLGMGPDYTGLFSTLAVYLDYLFTFLGSWSDIPLFFGISLFILFVLLSISGLWRKNPAIFAFLLFLFASALAATVSRAGIEVSQALSSRYKIYSLLLFALLYMALFGFLDRSWLAKTKCYIAPGVLVYLILLKLITVPAALDEMETHKQLLVNGLSTWKKQGKGLVCWDEEFASRTLTRAIHKDVYYLPDS